MKGGEAFFYKRGSPAFLVVHGFSSTPQEVRELGEYLAQQGITVSAPLLKGHGTIPDDLQGVDYTEWIEQMETEYRKLAKEHSEVWVGGSSMGGNIALHLASKLPVAGVIALATPVYTRTRFLMPSLVRIIKLFKKTWKKKYPPNVKKEIINKKIHYWSYPISSWEQAIKCLYTTAPLLPRVTAPTLIMQSVTDHIIKKENAEYLYSHLGSQDKKIVWVPDSYHVLTIDHWRYEAFREVERFILEHSKAR